MTATTILAGGSDRPLIEIEDQPGDCGPGCPCEAGPSDGTDYGMHWTPGTENRGRNAARRFYEEVRTLLAIRNPDTGADEVIAYRLLTLDVGEPMARRLLADPRFTLHTNRSETTRP